MPVPTMLGKQLLEEYDLLYIVSKNLLPLFIIPSTYRLRHLAATWDGQKEVTLTL